MPRLAVEHNLRTTNAWENSGSVYGFGLPGQKNGGAMGTECTTRFLETVSVPFDDIGPERIYYLYDPVTSLRAVVVIDSMRMGMSGGGVRMAPDLSLVEITRLA